MKFIDQDSNGSVDRFVYRGKGRGKMITYRTETH